MRGKKLTARSRVIVLDKLRYCGGALGVDAWKLLKLGDLTDGVEVIIEGCRGFIGFTYLSSLLLAASISLVSNRFSFTSQFTLCEAIRWGNHLGRIKILGGPSVNRAGSLSVSLLGYYRVFDKWCFELGCPLQGTWTSTMACNRLLNGGLIEMDFWSVFLKKHMWNLLWRSNLGDKFWLATTLVQSQNRWLINFNAVCLLFSHIETCTKGLFQRILVGLSFETVHLSLTHMSWWKR